MTTTTENRKSTRRGEEEKEDDDAPPEEREGVSEKMTQQKERDRELRTSGKCSKRNPNETAFKRSERKGKKSSKRCKRYATPNERKEES